MSFHKMTQSVTLILLLLANIDLPCYGLQLYFSQELDTEQRSESCGELICLHEVDISADIYNRSITTISIFRQTGPITNELVYSLDSNNSLVNRVSNQTAITGSLSTKKASLKVEIFKDGGCVNASFLCRVNTIDANGNNDSLRSFTTNNIAVTKASSSLDYSVFLDATASINDRISLLEKRFENSSHMTEDKVNGKLNSIENKIGLLDVRVDDATNQTKSLESVTKNILSAFHQLLRYETALVSGQNASFETLKRMIWNILYEMGSLEPLPDAKDVDARINDTYIDNKNTSLQIPTACERDMANRKDIVQMAEPFIILEPADSSPVLCDGKTDGGGWIIIQRRFNESTDFFRDWNQYKTGFGTFDGNFWLGNEKISQLTNVEDFATYELRVNLKYEGRDYYAHYSNFRLDSEENKYTLYVNGYSGTAGDGLSDHSGQPFGTKDRDFSRWQYLCGLDRQSGWWCSRDNVKSFSNINGMWGQLHGPFWRPLTTYNPVSFSQMMIRKL